MKHSWLILELLLGLHYAAIFPERVARLVMLDILGPAVNGDAREPERVVEVTSAAMEQQLRLEQRLHHPDRTYPTRQVILARCDIN